MTYQQNVDIHRRVSCPGPGLGYTPFCFSASFPQTDRVENKNYKAGGDMTAGGKDRT